MTSLTQKLSAILGAAFETQDLPTRLGTVRISDRPDLCQFQCNGAMEAAKLAKKNPRQVAQDVVANLEEPNPLANIEIAGPGFINVNVTDDCLLEYLNETHNDTHYGIEQTGTGQTIVLDYGGPNIAKPMHVGHLRSSIIGDSLRRILAISGYQTIGDVHMGDWGTPMGMILSELDITGHEGDVTMEQLAEIYPRAAADCKADETRMEKARAATKTLQDGDETYTKRWRQFIDISIEGMKKNFDALGVHFDEWKGEADAHPFIAPMVEGFKNKNIASEDDGALIVSVEQDDDKKEIPPLILLKSDGAVMYSTTDLATIIDRIDSHDPAKIIYIVDQRQSLHFEQVFRAALKGGIADEDKPELIFAGFGTMNGTDGKPFKTRAGGVMKLEDLINMAVEKAHNRLNEANLADDVDEAEREDIARKVALAAIKFADLQNQRQSDYIFDLDRMTAFEGKTGPYLLYQAVRIQSLLKKADDKGFLNGNADITTINDNMRDLSLHLAQLPDAYAQAIKNYAPHVLCDHAYKLAQAFSSFYANSHILSETDTQLRDSQLALCTHAHKQLVLILDMLGIKTPQRM